jgi:hypothetical protein
LISVHDGRPLPCWGRRPHTSASVPQHMRRWSEGWWLGTVVERGLQRWRLRLCGGAMAQQWRLTLDGRVRPPMMGAHALQWSEASNNGGRARPPTMASHTSPRSEGSNYRGSRLKSQAVRQCQCH